MNRTSEANVLRTRYNDAYYVARFAVGVGSTIKVIGIGLGSLVIIFSVIMATYSGSTILIFGGIILGAIIAFIFYIWGILMSAQGQILKASLDSAVNGSPFLSLEDKADIMSLKRLHQSQDTNIVSSDIPGRWQCICGGSNPDNLTKCQYCSRIIYADS